MNGCAEVAVLSRSEIRQLIAEAVREAFDGCAASLGDNPLAVNRKEAARLLGISPAKVDELRRTGVLQDAEYLDGGIRILTHSIYRAAGLTPRDVPAEPEKDAAAAGPRRAV